MDVCSKTMNSDRNCALHELIDAVQRHKRHTHGKTASGHIKILQDHGKDISALQTMVDFYVELAKPDTVGGVVVILERPSPAEETRYGGGYHSVIQKTKTLNKVKKLIPLVTNGALTIDDVTILDAFPLQPYDDFDKSEPRKSSRLLDKLLSAKRPDIVISCFRAGDHQGFIRILQHPGVGSETNNGCYPLKVRETRHEFKKIDAFHPSFAITYHADEVCFIQLLELQFAKGFGEWFGTWQEASWMDELRENARVRKAEIDGERATNSTPARNLRNHQVHQMTSQLARMSISNVAPASLSTGITIGAGNHCLRIPPKFLERARTMHNEDKTKQVFGTRT